MSKDNLNEISATLMQLFVSDVFNKNKITEETRKELTDDQKAKIKAVVLDLQTKVDEFLATQNQKKAESEAPPVETPKNTTLRDMLKNKKSSN